MTSPYDPSLQFRDLDARIVVALERISESFRVMLWEAGKKHKLSPIQVQLLIFLNYHDRGHCTITCLSEEFAMSKPTISEVVKTLVSKKLIQKESLSADSRSFYIKLTRQGKHMAGQMEHFSSPLHNLLSGHSTEEKARMFDCLVKALTGLRKDGVIRRQRMCTTCTHYSPREQSLYCAKLKKEIMNQEILLDCFEHSEATPA